MKYLLLVVLVASAVILVKSCDDSNDEFRHQTEITRLRGIIAADSAAIAIRGANIERLSRKVVNDSIKKTVAVMSLERENSRLRSRISKLSESVRARIDSVPDLRAYDAAKDSLIASQSAEIDTLKEYQRICELTQRDLLIGAKSQHTEIARIMANEYEHRKILEDENARLRKANKSLKKPAIAFLFGVLVGAFIPN